MTSKIDLKVLQHEIYEMLGYWLMVEKRKQGHYVYFDHQSGIVRVELADGQKFIITVGRDPAGLQ
jgi:hypothetical protein